MATISPETPGRGIASIAHHFLSQSSVGSQRSGPGKYASSVRNAEGSSNDAAVVSLEKIDPPPADSIGFAPSLKTETGIVLSSSLTRIAVIPQDADSDLDVIQRYAEQTAYHHGRVGLLRIDHERLALSEFDVSDSPEGPAETADINGSSRTGFSLDEEELSVLFNPEDVPEASSMKSKAASAEEQIGSGFRYIAERAETLLICANPPDDALNRQMILDCESAVIIARSDPDSLVTAYQHLKWLAGEVGFTGVISLFIDESDHAAAEAVHEKLARTAAQFLQVELADADFLLSYGAVEQKGLFYLAADDNRRECVLRYVVGQSQHVAADEKIQADCGGMEAPEREVVEAMQELSPDEALQGASSSVGRESKTAPAAATFSGAAIGRPIAVSVFPDDDTELTQTLAVSIGVCIDPLAGSVLLPIPRPSSVDPAVQFIVDQSNRCHIFLAGYRDNNLLVRSLAARQWLIEHLPLIAGACSHVRIDTSLEPGIVLITGETGESLRHAVAQLNPIPIQIKQVVLLDNIQTKALLVFHT